MADPRSVGGACEVQVQFVGGPWDGEVEAWPRLDHAVRVAVPTPLRSLLCDSRLTPPQTAEYLLRIEGGQAVTGPDGHYLYDFQGLAGAPSIRITYVIEAD